MAFVLAAGDADDVTTLDLRNLADDRADRTGGGGDHDGLAGLGLADMEQAEIGGQPGDAVDAEQMRHRLHLRHLGQVLCRHGRIILPAGIAEHDVARLEVRRFRGHDFGDAAAGHHGVGFDRGAIGGAVHPGPVGGIERDVARPHQRLAIPRLGHGRLRHLEMLRPQFAGRLLHQKDLAIDGVVHGVSPSVCSLFWHSRCNSRRD